MGKSIVVLEGYEGIREAMQIILSLEDYEIKSYESVKAFENRDGNQPDLFILDVMLPDGNGIEVCRVLKVINTTTPVLIMIAHASLKEINQGCAADDYIEKPDKVKRLFGGEA
ncbi:response regulator transcription factor [Pedobacter agri]|uniref:response regulator transcription factor n=1 Tax=Pedobacter agri TaxID=454586 RepID=UPI00292E22D4|nr:response regulator [Pedobacter agri]